MTRFTIGTRSSELAMVQTRWVVAELSNLYPEKEFRIARFQSEGDRRLDAHIGDIGGKGVFTQELTAALASGEIQAAVHSLKDLPVEKGSTHFVFPKRADACDAWVGRDDREFASLEHGGRVGTSSLRRAAQLKSKFPGVEIVPIRGNVQTRLQKIEEDRLDGVLLAAAGLLRLGLGDKITHRLHPAEMLPSPGQGILGVEYQDPGLSELLLGLEDADARDQALAERAFLRELQGGCLLPAGAFAELDGESLTLSTLLATPDGGQVVRATGTCLRERGAELGVELARQILEDGGDEIRALVR